MSFNQPRVFAPYEFGAGLRPMTWHELCARIAAVQDLRRALASASAGVEATSTGSFHGRAAQIIASEFSSVPAHLVEDEGVVNPTSSVNGKAQFGTTSTTDDRPAVGPR